MAAGTDGTDEVYDAIRVRLLTFTPLGGGTTLAERLAGGLSLIKPPNDAPAPYGVIRLADARHRRSQRGRLTNECEAQFFHRPASNARELERIADVADQAMMEWEYASEGLIVCTGYRRQTLPAMSEAQDPELLRIRTTYDLVYYPQFLTQYLTPA